jgi:hypothetical protein
VCGEGQGEGGFWLEFGGRVQNTGTRKKSAGGRMEGDLRAVGGDL